MQTRELKVEFINTHKNVKNGMTIINFCIVSQVAGPLYFDKLLWVWKG